MQDPLDFKNEIPDDFNNFNFGIPDVIAGYGGNMAVKFVAEKSTSKTAFICGVLKHCIAEKREFENSPPFHIGFDDAARLIYLRTEVRFKDLDGGNTDLDDRRRSEVEYNSQPGDKLHDYVPKKLGGPSSMVNWFPLNPHVKIQEWEAALDKVYEHVKQGEENTARILYAMIHAYRDEYSFGDRPSHFCYIFNLYTNGQFINEKIEGKINNPIYPHPSIA
uniref:Uncharacterized protein n=1 Tax=Panagrolaimus sp. ES5 TaxID=591445 RepID=A0AC34GT73_9BILA